jgi:hypothetical protein
LQNEKMTTAGTAALVRASSFSDPDMWAARMDALPARQMDGVAWHKVNPADQERVEVARWLQQSHVDIVLELCRRLRDAQPGSAFSDELLERVLALVKKRLLLFAESGIPAQELLRHAVTPNQMFTYCKIVCNSTVFNEDSAEYSVLCNETVALLTSGWQNFTNFVYEKSLKSQDPAVCAALVHTEARRPVSPTAVLRFLKFVATSEFPDERCATNHPMLYALSSTLFVVGRNHVRYFVELVQKMGRAAGMVTPLPVDMLSQYSFREGRLFCIRAFDRLKQEREQQKAGALFFLFTHAFSEDPKDNSVAARAARIRQQVSARTREGAFWHCVAEMLHNTYFLAMLALLFTKANEFPVSAQISHVVRLMYYKY